MKKTALKQSVTRLPNLQQMCNYTCRNGWCLDRDANAKAFRSLWLDHESKPFETQECSCRLFVKVLTFKPVSRPCFLCIAQPSTTEPAPRTLKHHTFNLHCIPDSTMGLEMPYFPEDIDKWLDVRRIPETKTQKKCCMVTQ